MRRRKQRREIIPILSTTRTITILRTRPPKMDTRERRPRYREVIEILDVEVEPAVDGEVSLAGIVVIGYGGHTFVGSFGGAFICTGVFGVGVWGGLERFYPGGVVSDDVAV